MIIPVVFAVATLLAAAPYSDGLLASATDPETPRTEIVSTGTGPGSTLVEPLRLAGDNACNPRERVCET